MDWVGISLTIIGSVLASSGFWAFLSARAERKAEKQEKNKTDKKLLLAIAHFRIYEQCRIALNNGYISSAEFENLTELYLPYHECGGNGTGTRMYEKVKSLPIKDD